MESEVNTAIVTPPPGEVAPPSTEPIVTVAEHAAQFDPKGSKEPASEPTETSAPSSRHRAQSQKATAADVPRIQELTKKLREAERERDEWKTKASPTPAADAPPVERPKSPATAVPSVSEFTEKEPALEQFADAADPYASWTRALARYDRRKEVFEEQQAAKEKEAETARTTAIERDNQAIAKHQERVTAFVSTTPDFQIVTADLMQRRLPTALLKAIATDDNGPQFIYTLAQHPDELDDLFVLAHGKSPDDDDFVATLQRRLKKLIASPVAAIGSTASPVHPPAPRPPNPMRTAPMKTGDDPPGDGHSLAEHAKFYSPKRR